MSRHVALIALFLAATGPAPAQSQEPGRLFLGLSSTYSVLPTDLPAPYLADLSGRTDVQGPSDLKDRIGLSARAGVVLGRGVSVAGVFDITASSVSVDLAGTRTGVDVILYAPGVDARKSLGEELYVLGGLGALIFDPEARDAETAASWTLGVGRRFKAFRWELKDRMTVTTFGEEGESTFFHVLQFSAGLELSL